MNTVYLLLPLAVLLSLVGLGLLIWSIRHGQFDDMEGPAHRILFEDDQEMIPVEPPTRAKERLAGQREERG
ncbi:MAG: cbb3-type cytochrome oxidase assembly protein CcoS [Magnetococcales bacterium]|nr:cbb3-type cytochrome oxidase assembly protein CcoS [Magnetococcales bacterium]